MSTQILVVDDSTAERLVIGRFLSRHPDFSVRFANDGAEALESVKSNPPDLILSDLRMPVIDGLEFVRQLRLREICIPVILMTSFGSEQIAIDALEAGAASYVPKRSLSADLVSTIRSVMEVTQRRIDRRRTLECLTFSETRFVIGNDTSSVTHLLSHLLDTAVAMRLLSGQEQTQVGIALQEALSNAIHHGNLELDSELRQVDENVYYLLADRRRTMKPYCDRKVHVFARLSRKKLTFVIADDGAGYDTSKVLDPTTKINLDRIGGRGLLLIHSFMDEVSHNDRGNQITLTKYVTVCAPETLAIEEANTETEFADVASCV